MRFLQNMTIKHKLISITLVTCVIALLMAGASFIAWEWMALRQNMVRNLSTQVEMIADNCKAAIAFGDVKDATEILGALKAESSIVSACIHNKKGEVFASYSRDKTGGATDLVYMPRPIELKKSGYVFENGLLNILQNIVLNGETIGTVSIRSDLTPMYVMLKRNTVTTIAVLLLAFLAAYFVSSRLQAIISRPILSLATVAKIVSEQKDYSTRAQKQSNDEVGLLINAFNEMLEQIQQRDLVLVNTNEELEVRVKERTAEITGVNEQLTKEIAVRKQAESTLRENEEKYHTLFDTANDAIFVMKGDKFADCNIRTLEMFGCTKEQIIGHSPYRFSPPTQPDGRNSQEKALEKINAALAGQPQFFEWTHVKYDGTPFYVEIGLNTFELKGGMHIQAIVRDITERKKAEEELENLNRELEDTVEKLTLSNRELQDFAHITAHDLKAPLRAIGTLADWISTDYGDKLDETGRQQVRLLVKRAERMSGLVDSILQYSEVGRVVKEKTKVELNELIKDVILDIGPPDNMEITVIKELPTILCEKTRMRQVFQNLLSNAIKYMDKPKGRIDIDFGENDEFWKFSVADNGPGIEAKYFEKIFKIFQTLAPRDELESTGIGLSVVKKIVEMYGGRVWVESEIGNGSTFFFTWPKEESEAANNDIKLEANLVG